MTAVLDRLTGHPPECQPTRQIRTSMTSSDRPVWFASDVARIWSEHAGREISVATVWSYLSKSRSGRYADDPMPAPEYEGGQGGPGRGARPFWLATPEVRRELCDWWDRRAGRIGDPRRERPS